MRREQRDGLTVYRFRSIPDECVNAFVSTRGGGRSRPPYASLNLALHVGDDEAVVVANRQALFTAFGLRLRRSVWGAQVHGDRVHVVTAADAGRGSVSHGDAIAATDALVTDQAGVTLCIASADCVPVVLYDPRRHVAGIAHAGWAGTVACIATRTVEAMRARFDCAPEDLLAAIGPSIGPADYEVGTEVVAAVNDAFAADAERVLSSPPAGGSHLDLWEANALALEHAGVARTRIEIAAISTAATLHDLYSHRAEGPTGRFITAVCLAPRDGASR